MATKNPYQVGGEEAIAWEKEMGQGTAAGVAASTPGLTAEQIAAEQVKNEPINPDVAAGNLLMQQNKTAPTTTPAPTPEKPPVASTADAADTAAENAGAAVTTAASGLSTSSEAAYQQAFDILGNMAKTSAADRLASVENIQRQRDIAVEDTTTGQRLQSGATSRSMARMGGYLGGSGSGTAYMNSLGERHRLEMTKLQADFAGAIEKAKAAYDMKDIDLANKLMSTAQSYQQQIEAKRTNDMDLAIKATELMQFERDTDLLNLDAWAEQGYTSEEIPSEIFAEMDKKGGYRSGTAQGLYAVMQKNKAIKDIKDQQELQKAELEQATTLHNILKTVPAGQPVTIGGYTYYGTSGLGDIEVNETTGEASVFTVGENGKITQKFIGNVGATKDGWENEKIGGEIFRFNPSTGEYKSYLGPKVQLNEIVPPGVYQSTNFKDANGNPLPFQCGELVNELCGAIVGSTLTEKIARIDADISAETAIEGNTIIFGGSSTGHVAVINRTYTDKNGRLKFVLSEANYPNAGEIRHDREVYADDKGIKGFMGTSFVAEYASGSDAGRLEAAIARENAGKSGADSVDPLSVDAWAKGLIGGYRQIDNVPTNIRTAVNARFEELKEQGYRPPVDVQKLGKQVSGVKNTLDIVNKALGQVSPETAGWGALTTIVPGSPAKSLGENLGTIKANLGFDKLQEMRDNSPTGGALGQVSEREIDFLQKTVSSLNQQLDDKVLAENLKEIQQHYQMYILSVYDINPDKISPNKYAEIITKLQGVDNTESYKKLKQEYEGESTEQASPSNGFTSSSGNVYNLPNQ